MSYRSVRGFTGWAQLALVLALTGVGIALAAVIQMLVGTMALGIPTEELANRLPAAMALPQNAGYAQLVQIAGTFCMFCMPAFIYLFVSHGSNFVWLGFSHRVTIYQVLLAFGIIFLANYCADSLQQLTKYLLHFVPALDAKARAAEQAYNEQVQIMGSTAAKGAMLKAVLIMAILPAFFEEVFFRGTLQGLFARWWGRPFLAMIVVSVLFSLIHMSYYLFLSRALLGYILCWLFFRSRNLWVNIIAHALNNFLAVLALFSTAVNGKTDLAKVTAANNSYWWVGFPALLGVLALGYIFKKLSEDSSEAILQEERLLQEKAKPFTDYLNDERKKRV